VIFYPHSDVSSYCMTTGCVNTASDILSNMDVKENPCKDFYQFACGGFMERTSIPDDRTRMSSFSVLGDKLLTQVRMLLEEGNSEGEPKPFQMARNVYKSCMDKKRIEQLGTQPLKNTILVSGKENSVIGEIQGLHIKKASCNLKKTIQFQPLLGCY
jgi:predicted metalloendopeptidase